MARKQEQAALMLEANQNIVVTTIPARVLNFGAHRDGPELSPPMAAANMDWATEGAMLSKKGSVV